MKITPFYGWGSFNENSYIITDDKSGASAVVDPNYDNNGIMEIIHNYKIEKILLTHCHFDHICSAARIREMTGAEIYIHKEDADGLKDKEINLSSMFGASLSFEADHTFSDGETIMLGETSVKVIHTPGHTAGSSCFVVDDSIISGDTLFHGSVGRMDFPTGSPSQMNDSLRKLKNLEKDYKIYPGHGDMTTLHNEVKNNPFFN